MITSRQVNAIRRNMFRTDYALTDELAEEAAKDRAGIYETIRNPGTHLIYMYQCEFIKAILKSYYNREPSQIHILDWGGGKGYTTYLLQKAGFKVTCFEVDNFKHRRMWKAFDLPVVTGGGEGLPFSNETFDAVVGFGVLEHVPYDYESLKELNRVLTDQGLLFVMNLPSATSYINHYWHAKKVFYHDRLYGKREVKQLLKRSGLKLCGPIWHRQLLPKRLVHFKRFRFAESLDLWLTEYTPLRYVATDIEFIARKQEAYTSDH